ncbi:hypothetical protein [Gemmatimonas sp.]|uniref:hypothetical protein n=1 Tax=Gemmatimonas sp. TaxID=1962908 RepID=UPI0039831BCF
MLPLRTSSLRRSRARCAAAFVLLSIATNHVAAAPATSTTAEQRKAAAAKFKEGETAFVAGDYLHAGAAFEEAYRIAPHSSGLWNAARAWHKGGDTRRAAGLYSRYLREAPLGDPDRKSATAALLQLSAKLGRFEIQAPGADQVTIDGGVVEGPSAFVHPGTHTLRASFGGKTVERSLFVEAGATVNVSVSAPSEPAASATAPIPTTPPPARLEHPNEPPPKVRSGLSPAFVWASGIATIAVGGVAVWSGLDTNHARTTFDADPSEANLASGRDKQTRTNVLLGVTAGMVVLTAATAIFLVDWGAEKRAEIASSISASPKRRRASPSPRAAA